jgi:hypothetical protein
MKPRIIFVCPCYPPSTSVSSLRIERFALLFRNAGYDVNIVSPLLDGLPKSNNLKHKRLEGISVTPVNVLFKKYFSRAETAGLDKYIIFLSRMLTFTLNDYGWIYIPSLIYSTLKLLKDSDAPTLIFVSGPPFMPMMAIALISKFLPRVKVVADYRDSWHANPSRSILRPSIISYWGELLISIYCDFFVSASKGCGASLVRSKKVNVLTIYNLPSRSYEIELDSVSSNPEYFSLSRSKLNIVYTGSLYNHISLDIICRSLASLPSHICEMIRFYYCGYHSQRALKSFTAFNLQNILVDYGLLSKEECLSLAASADLCIAITSSYSLPRTESLAERGEIPTKIFDYIALKKQVAHICPPGYEIVNLLNQLNYPFIVNFSPHDNNRLTDFLYEYAFNLPENKILDKSVAATNASSGPYFDSLRGMQEAMLLKAIKNLTL